MSLDIHSRTTPDYTLLNLSGQLDGSTSASLDDELQRLISLDVKQIILDCSQLSLISSAGLKVLLTAVQALNNTGKLSICSANKNVSSLIALSGLGYLITLFTNANDAKNAIR